MAQPTSRNRSAFAPNPSSSSLSLSLPALPVRTSARCAPAAGRHLQSPAGVRPPALACRPPRTEALADPFWQLFADSDSDRPECPRGWRGHLPPLARLVLQQMRRQVAPEARQTFIASAIRSGMSVLDIDSHYGRPVLHWACILASADIVGLLLSLGAFAHLDREDAAGNTPLQCALSVRRLTGGAQVVEALLDAGASPAALPHRGAELLYLNGLELPLIRRLLAWGVDVEGGGAREASPLHHACTGGLWGRASLLLEHGADIARTGPLRDSVLHHGQLPVWLAEQFRRRGADVNARNLIGETPLMRACAYRNIPLARWLLVNGAWPDVANTCGRTVAAYAHDAGPAIIAWLQQQSPGHDDRA